MGKRKVSNEDDITEDKPSKTPKRESKKKLSIDVVNEEKNGQDIFDEFFGKDNKPSKKPPKKQPNKTKSPVVPPKNNNTINNIPIIFLDLLGPPPTIRNKKSNISKSSTECRNPLCDHKTFEEDITS